MKKPLVAASFFTFPKLLLWSLPIGFLLAYTWLFRGQKLNLSQLILQTEGEIDAEV
jgi:hypothetical protein